MGLSLSQYPGLDEHGGQVPSACGPDWPIPHAKYTEKLLVGYRWYTAHPETKPAFAFGHGLSYTTFEYGPIAVVAASALASSSSNSSSSSSSSGGGGGGSSSGSGSSNHTVSLSLTNTGAVAGAEVAQLYLKFPEAAGEPPLQLKGFKKVFLQPKARYELSFVLDAAALSIFDAAQREWVVQRGEFVASVGGGLDALVQHVSFTN
jgi:hypothetical protein